MDFPYDPIENSRIGLLEGEVKKKTRVSLVVLRHRVTFREKRERERRDSFLQVAGTKAVFQHDRGIGARHLAA